jgi:hypothetical protein
MKFLIATTLILSFTQDARSTRQDPIRLKPCGSYGVITETLKSHYANLYVKIHHGVRCQGEQQCQQQQQQHGGDSIFHRNPPMVEHIQLGITLKLGESRMYNGFIYSCEAE